MNMIDKFKETYRQLDRKADFKKAAAEEFGVTPGTIANHWISAGNIPAEHQKEFMKLLKKAIKNQRKYLNSLKN